MRRTALCIAALSLHFAAPATAQLRTLEEGTRVRVAPAPGVAADRWIVGTVLPGAADSLTLLRVDTGTPFSLHRRDVDAVQVSTGHRRTGPTVARYALVGAAVGATAGALLGVAAHADDSGDGWEIVSRGEMATIGAGVFGLAGTAVGGLVGWRMSGEQWARVPFRPTPALTLRPDGGVGVTLSLTR